jgi:hypothetical protein
VRDALKLIEPVPEARSYCGHEVEVAKANIGFELYQLYCGARLKSTTTKRAARSASAALKRAINILRKLEFLVPMEGQPRLFKYEGFPRDKVPKCVESLDQAARLPYGKIIQEKAETKRLAAIEAHHLLLEFGTGRRIVAAKGSRYERLTALLSGDTKADLSSVCRAHLRKVKSGDLGLEK